MQVIPSAVDGEVFEVSDKFGNTGTFRLCIEQDNDCDAPWEREDGHGEVTEWTTRDKRPGERLLNSCRGGSNRFYDVQQSQEIALRDGWGCNGDTSGMSPRQVAAMAVEQDFQRLRAWCNDQWSYVGVIVTYIPPDLDESDVPTDYSHALWGIESDDDDYIKETMLELAREALAEL